MKFINFILDTASSPELPFLVRLAACTALVFMVAAAVGGPMTVLNGLYWSYKLRRK